MDTQNEYTTEDGVRLVAEQGDSCAGCYFQDNTEGCLRSLAIVACTPKKRTDARSIIWVKPEAKAAPRPALSRQEGGSHYKGLKIQPIEYIHANGIPFAEGSVIKYVTRWRDKGGIRDLEKARHFIDLLIELESKSGSVLGQRGIGARPDLPAVSIEETRP